MRIKLLKQLDLLLAILIALLNILWMERSGHVKTVGLLLAFPQVFLLPGYTFVEVLFHRHPIDGVRRIVLSFGLSIALDILGGLVINMFPLGLTRVSWSFYLGFLTITLSLTALCLRGKNALNGLWVSQIRLNVRKHLVGLLFLGAASGIVIFSFIFSDYSALHQHRKGFTQFWIVQNPQPNKTCSVLIGVDSFEFILMRYHVILTVNNAHPLLISPIILHPQKTWKAIVPITVPASGNALVSAQLYRLDKPATVYRNVHLTLQGPDAGKNASAGKSQVGSQCTT